MHSTIDRASLIPLPDPAQGFWARIANDIADAISQGVYEPGQRLPSEHLLAAQFGVNRHTIRRSLSSLCQLGVLRSAQGSGTFVEDSAIDLVLGRRTRHHHSLDRAGLRGGLELISSAQVPAVDRVALALNIAPGASVLHLRVVGTGGGLPLHAGDRYFPLPRFAGLDQRVAESGSISEAFASLGVKDYVRTQSRLSARMPSDDIAALLKQAPMRPAMLVSSVNTDDDNQPIEFARTWFAGDRVAITIEHSNDTVRPN
jgi:GntR family phosphonate transport system transcriptional regulator